MKQVVEPRSGRLIPKYPIAQGRAVATLELRQNGAVIGAVPLLAATSIARGGMIDRLADGLLAWQP